MSQPIQSSRRDFLTGRAAQAEVEQAGGAFADAMVEAAGEFCEPGGGSTVRLSTRAMACDFAVLLNPGPAEQVMAASAALDEVHALEDQMSAYRPHSELSRLNRTAADSPVAVERRLFELLLRSRDLSFATEKAFDPTAGPLIALWRQAKQEGRIPTDAEIADCLARVGIEHVVFDEAASTIRFTQPGVELNLGSIGKGHALDRAASHLQEQGDNSWLFHGGHSSMLARGEHNGNGGWPVGIRNPLFPKERFATLLLKDCGLSSSGSGVQYFRHAGKRYGHILDPRTGWPVEDMLSATVLAPTATEAEALSTAFFVGGVEKAVAYCDNHEGIGAILVPPPRTGKALEPVVCGTACNVFYMGGAP